MYIELSREADELYVIDKGHQVSFELESTQELDDMIDAIRQRNGYAPFFDESVSSCICDGWYEFYLEVDVAKRKILGIVAVVQEESSPDDKAYYRIEEYTSFDTDEVMEQLVENLKRYNTTLAEIEREVREYV